MQGCSGLFGVVHSRSAGNEGHSQTALGKNYKALGKNYTALGKNYKGDSSIYLLSSFMQVGFQWQELVAKLYSKVIYVNATMHFCTPDSPQ